MQDNSSKIKEHKSSDTLSEDINNEPMQKIESDVKHSKRRFFSRMKIEKEGVSQVTNINIEIHPDAQDDPVSGCLKGICKFLK